MTWITPLYCQQSDATMKAVPEPHRNEIAGSCLTSALRRLSRHRSQSRWPQDFTSRLLDCFDLWTLALGALFGAKAQWTNASPLSVRAFAGMHTTSVRLTPTMRIGYYTTEAIFPVMLYHDPRCFRRGTGAGWSRLGYAAGQVFWTHSDSGRDSS